MNAKINSSHQIQNILALHYKFLRKNNFLGWDVFDGLNSRLFSISPFSRSFIRLAWIQFFKRFPVNLRFITFVPKTDNAKALALLISALLYQNAVSRDREKIETALALYKRLFAARSKNYKGLAWGYNFDWQARAFFVPKFTPNMVATVFAGHALLDLYVATKEKIYLEQAYDVAHFILSTLILFENDETLCFNYVPHQDAIVHNVNFLGAAYLARLYQVTNDPHLKTRALKAVKFSVAAQREDGAWVYGDRDYHQWVDNFHTGYNLVSLFQYQEYCNDIRFKENLIKGFQFHLKNHFTSDYLPKYTDKKLFPIDVHCFSQAILTGTYLHDYSDLNSTFLEKTSSHAIHLLFDNKKHFFYYQKHKCYINKIPYMRWSQAWMFFAFSKLNYFLIKGKNDLV